MKTSYLWFTITLLAIAGLTAIGPAEKSLGSNVRVVYLHGVWVWTALAAFFAAALSGAVGLLTQRPRWQCWSRALGRTGLIFWITYLPISIWAMQTNWNGLFLAEPRWRLAVVFALTGGLLQLGVTMLEKPAWASAVNLVFFLILILALQNTSNVMHPPSPILNSEAWRIRIFFSVLFGLALLAAGQTARLLYTTEPVTRTAPRS